MTSAQKYRAMRYGITRIQHAQGADGVHYVQAEQALQAHPQRMTDRLLHWARQFGKANALKELLFHAYFTRGWDLNDLATLAQLAAEAGLDGDEARAQLETGQYADDALADLKMADRFGIRGVPFFVFNRQFSVSGAQPVATFLRAIDQAVAGE